MLKLIHTRFQNNWSIIPFNARMDLGCRMVSRGCTVHAMRLQSGQPQWQIPGKEGHLQPTEGWCIHN